MRLPNEIRQEKISKNKRNKYTKKQLIERIEERMTVISYQREKASDMDSMLWDMYDNMEKLRFWEL